MVCKASTRLFLLATGSYFGLRSYTSAGVIRSGVIFSATAVRLVPFPGSGAALSPQHNSSTLPAFPYDWSGATLQLLRDGCAVTPGHVPPRDTGAAAAIFDLGTRVEANGFELALPSSALPPPGWLFEAATSPLADDNGSTVEWRAVGASTFRRSFTGTMIPFPTLPFAGPAAAAADASGGILVDFRPDWQWASQFVAAYGLAVFSFSAMLGLAAANQQWHARCALAAHFGVVSVLYAAAAATHQLAGRGREAAAIWMILPEHVTVAIGFLACKGR
jgi:hypothetical protein